VVVTPSSSTDEPLRFVGQRAQSLRQIARLQPHARERITPTVGLCSELVRDDAMLAPPDISWARAAGGPVDRELLQLDAGLRALIKRERGSREASESVARRLASAGRRTRVFHGGSGRLRSVAFVALDDETLGEAMRLEALLDGAPPDRAEAVRGLGRLLGYPECCVERLAAEPLQDDDTQIARLAVSHVGRLGLFDNWVSVELRSFSHFPCRSGCPATAALSRKTLDLIERSNPGFGTALRSALASVAVVQSLWRYALLLDASVDAMGAVSYGSVLSQRDLGMSTEDPALRDPELRAFHREVIEPLQRGNHLVRDETELSVHRDGELVTRIAFSPSAPRLLDFSGTP
jgi:hypothetical protein